MKTILLIIVTSILWLASIQSYSQALNQQQLESFCSDKPIWLAFSIAPDKCTTAVKQCLAQKRFSGIDPERLNEAFYECVFKKLDIDIE